MDNQIYANLKQVASDLRGTASYLRKIAKENSIISIEKKASVNEVVLDSDQVLKFSKFFIGRQIK